MGSQYDLPQATKPYAIVQDPHHRDAAPNDQHLFPILNSNPPNPRIQPLQASLHLFFYYYQLNTPHDSRF